MKNKEYILYAAKELLAKGNFEIIEEVFTVNYSVHTNGKVYKGYDFLREFSKKLHQSISDIQIVKLEFFAEEKNTISWERTLEGKHLNSIMKIPASNCLVEWKEIVISRFEGNKIAEEWIVSELMGKLLLQQQ